MNLAGESDADIDRLSSFRDAVTGYSSLLYSLPREAGFEELIACAQKVWDYLQKDEKLTEKLVSMCVIMTHLSCFLMWVPKMMKQTDHFSVIHSSLFGSEHDYSRCM